MRAWMIAIALVAACKGGKEKDSTTTTAAPKAAGPAVPVPTVGVATVLAKDDPKPPFLLLVDDSGMAKLAAAKTWADIDANSLTVSTKATQLDNADKYTREVYALGRDHVEAIREWNENPEMMDLEDTSTRQGATSQDDPPPPPPDDIDDGRDESGGTGTALALDEGKMGKKDSDRAEGQYKMKKDDPQLARQQAIEQARRAGVLGSRTNAALSRLPGGDGMPSRNADAVGFVANNGVIDRLRAMIAIAPTAKAVLLIEAVRQTGAAIAVSYNGKIRPLNLDFGTHDSVQPATEAASWLEARVSATAIAVEAVPDKPVDVTDIAQLGAALDKARTGRDLPKETGVDVLVDPDVTAQRLVDIVVALEASGVKVVGVGPALSPQELARRGHRIAAMAIGQPNANGDLDKKEIRAVVHGAKDKIQACYEKALQTSPDLHGTLQAQFFITPNGSVASSTANGVSPDVASCVAGVIKTLTFPKPKGGGGVQVNYPFTMRN